MAEAEGEMSSSTSTKPKKQEEYLEVKCESSGKTRRFAPGTEAGFAVWVINRKLSHEYEHELSISVSSSKTCRRPSMAVNIEAIKQGSDEEPISFGPNSLLLNYGPSWTLHTVLDTPLSSSSSSSGVAEADDIPNSPPLKVSKPVPLPLPVHGSEPSEQSAPTKVTKPAISLVYIGKIVLAFILLFLLGAIFTLALDNLPLLISFITSAL